MLRSRFCYTRHMATKLQQDRASIAPSSLVAPCRSSSLLVALHRSSSLKQERQGSRMPVVSEMLVCTTTSSSALGPLAVFLPIA